MAIQIDYYRVLQVHEDADQEIISAAYKCLSKLYHPDINKTKSAAQRMTDINVAYAVIGDERRRKEYHHEWLRQKKEKQNQSPTFKKIVKTKDLRQQRHILTLIFVIWSMPIGAMLTNG